MSQHQTGYSNASLKPVRKRLWFELNKGKGYVENTGVGWDKNHYNCERESIESAQGFTQKVNRENQIDKGQNGISNWHSKPKLI